jgi:hypothetical protein
MKKRVGFFVISLIVLALLVVVLVIVIIDDEDESSIGKCSQTLVGYGDCKMLIYGYVYNKDTSSCSRVSVGGCSADIPFENLSECEESCVDNDHLEKLCEDTGGVYSECADFEGIMDPCPIICTCSGNKIWDSNLGCVDKPTDYECSNNSDCIFYCGRGCLTIEEALTLEPTDVACNAVAQCECFESKCRMIS